MDTHGTKIRELRESHGMTQDVLAQAAGCDRRTIQRAEDGRRLQLETLAGIASVLQVSVGDIVRNASGAIQEHSAEDKNAVVLRRTTSGKVLLDALAAGFSGSLECDAEPTPDTVDLLVALVTELESLMPDPWDETKFHERGIPLSERLRRAFAVTAQLETLNENGIGTFVGTYTARAQCPRYDMDEGHLYVTTRQPFEPVTVCKVRIAVSAADKIVLVVDDIWQTPSLDPVDEIPF